MDIQTVTIEKPETDQFHSWAIPFHQDRGRYPRGAGRAVPGIKFGLAFCEASGNVSSAGRDG